MTGEAGTASEETLPMCLACAGRGYNVAYDGQGRGFVRGCIPCNGSGKEGGEDPLEARRRRIEAASGD